MNSIEDIDFEETITDISVLVSETLIPQTFFALESQWQHAGYKDWVYRLDPQKPEIPSMRHLHIAKAKHQAAKNMQASWADNGTQHDRKTFNNKVGNQKFVRELAKKILKLGPDISLEDNSTSNNIVIEAVAFSKDAKEAYLAIMRVNEHDFNSNNHPQPVPAWARW